MRKIILGLIVLTMTLMGTVLNAQLNVGSLNPPNADAALQITSPAANKGILFPLVALTLTTSASPLTAHVQGMVVYNTADANDVFPGIYFNDGTKWISLSAKPVDAIRDALSTNQNAYRSAATNTWVTITAAEYANILSTVSGAGVNGVDEATFASINTGAYFAGNNTYSVNQNNSTQVPAASYPIAMKFRIPTASPNVSAQLKFGASPQNTYKNYIGITPTITNSTVGGSYYYVIKAPTAALTSAGFVGVYIGGAPLALASTMVPATVYFTYGSNLANGGNMATSDANGYQPEIQVLSTPTKNW